MNKIYSIVFLLLATSIIGCGSKNLSVDSSEMDIMVGQMVMVGFRGMDAAPDSFIVKDIRDAKIGGVILFSKDCALNSTERNISDYKQVEDLTASLQKQARIPLFVAADQEGGLICRFAVDRGFPSSLSAAELGNSGDLKAAFRAGKAAGKTLSSVGVNVDFAPVVDVNRNAVNPVIAALQRSFSDDPVIVADFAKAFIDGLHSEKVISCLKHFPGHGSSAGDSHKGFTDVTDSWSEDELIPYRKLINDHKVDMVMTAHIYNNKLDKKYPATLSRSVITGLLRNELGFKGVVVTDDMQMQAVSGEFGFKDSVFRAVDAGADILLFGNNLIYEPGLGIKAVGAIKELVREGRISERRIRQSYERIMLLKNQSTLRIN
ncbi:beta-N-acetylhexosaminidase [Maridesulfovibrio ferrireducens]|uniref:beta-N-acetylhexosaminidase n=1 Tax=Maridesulfovibrio ferrireducens TaxID=246191 RepID=A0A1G9FFC0_9BACT|nr:glycoside hydrolase family 3 protein [Maridesulfovibrio ferrireducens]SDK87151.1 beta-N-acetylhexosaminidase [Maridesulfovibrio ferrireducens]